MRRDEPSRTALRVALARAIETLLPEKRRLCADPYAKYFLDEPAKHIYASWLRRRLFHFRSDYFMPGVIGSVMVRTQFVDDYLKTTMAVGIEQLVILGAGYDTRAFRINALAKGVKVFEVDHPATQERKKAITKTAVGELPAHVAYVPFRFNSEDLIEKLDAVGYRKNASTLFIWEGVTYYISPQAVDDTLRCVVEGSGAGSSIVFDYFPPSVADGTCHLKEARTMRAFFARFGEGILFGIEPEIIEAFLSDRGFDQIHNFTCQDFKKIYLGANKRKRKLSELFFIVHATVRDENYPR